MSALHRKADWTYLFAAQDMTTSGTISLLLATPSNIFVSWLFIYGFVKLTGERSTAASHG